MDVIFLSWIVPCGLFTLIPIFMLLRICCTRGKEALYRLVNRNIIELFGLFLAAYSPAAMAAIAIACYASECPCLALLVLAALINACLYPFRILLLGKHKLGVVAIYVEIEVILIFYLSWFWLYDLQGRWLFGFRL